MKRAGADGILSVTPYYNKPTPEGLFQHYSAIADAVELPIIVYNVPGRTGCNVDPGDAHPAQRVPHIVGVKEASGNMTQMCEICARVPDDFIVLSGDDALTLPLMAVGGRGIISVAANEIPAEMAWSSWPSRGISRARARSPAAAAAADGELHRVQSHSGEERDGLHGAARRGLSSADGAAAPASKQRIEACSSRWLGAGVHA